RHTELVEDGGDGIELHLPEAPRVARDLVPDRLPVIRQRDELDVEGGAAQVGPEPPYRPQRPVHLHCPGESLDALFGATAVDLEKEVVHRAEVVVDELRLEAGFGRDAPR